MRRVLGRPPIIKLMRGKPIPTPVKVVGLVEPPDQPRGVITEISAPATSTFVIEVAGHPKVKKEKPTKPEHPVTPGGPKK